MINKLEQLKDFILNNLHDLDAGFHYTIKDATDKQIFAITENGFRAIFPDDRIGNYFFFLVDGDIKFSKIPLADCGGKNGYIDSIPFTIYTLTKGFDSVVLLSNLRKIISLSGIKVSIQSANIYTEKIMLELLRGIDQKDINSALSALQGKQMIKINCVLTDTFFVNNCLEDMCKSC